MMPTKNKTISYDWQEYFLCAICYIKISNSITYKWGSPQNNHNLELLNSSSINNATDANSQLNMQHNQQ